jgi:hypothetical protein
VGLPYGVLTGPDSLLRHVRVDGAQMERHLYLILPPRAETSPAAAAFAAGMLALHSNAPSPASERDGDDGRTEGLAGGGAGLRLPR